MVGPRRLVGAAAGCAILLMLAGGPVRGQGHGPQRDEVSDGREATETVGSEHGGAEHEGAEHEFHRNHFGGFLGGSTHSDTNETAFTIGLEYARQFSRRWAAAVYLEQLDSDLERDTVLLVGVVYYPVRGLGVVLAPGIEGANRAVEEEGETVQENEAEFLVRLGAAYGFRLSPTAALGPSLYVDRAGHRWTYVFGLAMVVGF